MAQEQNNKIKRRSGSLASSRDSLAQSCRNRSTSIMIVFQTVWPQWTTGHYSVRVLLEDRIGRWTSNIMRTESFHADEIAKALRRSKIATMPELKRALGTEVDVTIFRKLKQPAIEPAIPIVAVTTRWMKP